MKMFWFFNATTEIPFSFKLCGIFQMLCDILLGVQYCMYGSGEAKPTGIGLTASNKTYAPFRPPSRVHTPLGDKEGRLE